MFPHNPVSPVRTCVFCTALVLALFLAPPQAVALPTCSSGTLANYVALGSTGCSVGDVTLSDFSFAVVASTPSPGTQIATADTILIASLNSVLDRLQFTSSAFNVATGGDAEYSFGYRITAPEAILAGLGMDLLAESPVVPGTARANAVGTITGAGGNPLFYDLFVVHAGGPEGNKLNAETEFAEPTSQIDVRFWLDLDASNGGTSQIVGIAIYVPDLATTAVPEPSTFLLLASGLVGLGGVAWRRHRRG